MSVRGIWANLTNKRELDIDQNVVNEIVEKHGAESWFSYVIEDRKNRWDVWETAFWIARTLPSSARILETGCGIASNLIWLSQQGFKNLDGTDLVDSAVAAGKELSERCNADIKIWKDNGLTPETFPEYNYDVVIALNWTHLLSEFSLSKFLETYAPKINKGGYVINDVINSTYGEMENNQYLTSDLDKPVEQRQPSEYKKRYSDAEVESEANKAGFKVIKKIVHEQKIPKTVFIFQKI